MNIYTSATLIRGLAVDDSNIYWTTASGVYSCPATTTACTPTQVIAAADASGLVLDTTGLYWNDGAHLMRCAPNDCAATATPIAACGRSPDMDLSSYGFTAPFFLAADAEYLYCPRPGPDALPHVVVIRIPKPL